MMLRRCHGSLAGVVCHASMLYLGSTGTEYSVFSSEGEFDWRGTGLGQLGDISVSRLVGQQCT